jgi:hypothetical protein
LQLIVDFTPPVAATQALPHPLEQHFKAPSQSLSSVHEETQIPTESLATGGQIPDFVVGAIGASLVAATHALPHPLKQHFKVPSQSLSSKHEEMHIPKESLATFGQIPDFVVEAIGAAFGASQTLAPFKVQIALHPPQ